MLLASMVSSVCIDCCFKSSFDSQRGPDARSLLGFFDVYRNRSSPVCERCFEVYKETDASLSVPETLTCDVISSCTRVRLSGAERVAHLPAF